MVQKSARSADHLDSPATKADGTVDINDVYTWNDGTNVALVMTVTPAAAKTALFSDTAQYVIHTASAAAYPVGGNDNPIICTFSGATAPQTVQCWAGTDDYVTGQADTATGITSKSGKFKVFAGVRADPFFFNLDGFKATVADVEAAGTLPTNDAGCPLVPGPVAATLVAQLSHAPDGGAPSDFFKTLNTLAIVVQIDKALVTKNGPILAVWASTNK